MVIKGTKITMQQPRLTGFTTDVRAYEFSARAAAQDITKPDLVELQQIRAKVEMADKSIVHMWADTGLYNMKTDMLTSTTTSTWYPRPATRRVSAKRWSTWARARWFPNRRSG